MTQQSQMKQRFKIYPKGVPSHSDAVGVPRRGFIAKHRVAAHRRAPCVTDSPNAHEPQRGSIDHGVHIASVIEPRWGSWVVTRPKPRVRGEAPRPWASGCNAVGVIAEHDRHTQPEAEITADLKTLRGMLR